jgi:hypothetical protein
MAARCASSNYHVTPRPVLDATIASASLTVAAGARMRGQAEFGWDDGNGSKAGKRSNGHGAVSGATS